MPPHYLPQRRQEHQPTRRKMREHKAQLPHAEAEKESGNQAKIDAGPARENAEKAQDEALSAKTLSTADDRSIVRQPGIFRQGRRGEITETERGISFWLPI